MPINPGVPVPEEDLRMALRLIDLPEPEPGDSRPGRPLHARAAACLRGGDLAGYRKLFTEAAAVEHAQERYLARRRLIEAGLGAAAGVRPNLLAQLFLAVAEKALEVLEEEAREPLLLNYAGVALYELGALGPARALFEAALRLDQDLPHLRRNLDETGRRARRRSRPALPARVSAALPGAERAAERVAGRARPAEGLTLSLCMIVKDEEEMLPRSLAAVRDVVDELIVVDTGSSDRTVEIAREFGAKVIEREWTGSFADARNASFDAAGGDWIMYLDADEVLVAEDAPLLRELTGRVWREAFYLVETNHTGDIEDGMAVTHNALRVFRNRPEYRFEGRIHEQIAHRLPAGQPERLEPTRVRVEHYGYLGAVRDSKEKSRRNIELLQRQVEEGAATPFLRFNLGSEHAAAGDAPAALREFEAAWKELREDPELASYGYTPSLMGRLVRALRINGRLDDAVGQAEEGLEIFPGYTDLVLEQATAARQRGERDQAAALYERCLEMGDAPSRYSATVGSGSYLALVALAELRAGRGELEEAERLLARCLDAHPGFLGSVLPLATAMLRRGADPDAVVGRVEERVSEVSPSVRFMLGTALYEAGNASAAEEQFRGVLSRQPESDPARLALAEALLSQSRLEDAAALASEVPDGSPLAPAAARTELFGLVAAASPAGEALSRAGARGLPAAELDLLGAWDATSGDGALPPSLPAESAPLLMTMLEALLRIEAFEAFERLVPAVDRVGLGWRSRRELLGSMYLRRGFLESAADEWIAVCQDGAPDGDALVGLAKVAAARGMADDALVFAQEAVTLEPGRPDAAGLMSQLAGAASS
ncbi:MAG: glycosyltransferase [Thermoleophilaceae bacterium]